MIRRRGPVRALLAAALLALLVASAACGRPLDRPIRGASPGSDPAPTVGVPPTLAPSEDPRFRALPTPSPGIAASSPSPSPIASPSASAVPAPPIVRTIAPANNGRVPAGAPVAVSAVLVGRGADLASASLQVDGADTGAQIDRRTPREWTIRASRALEPGAHTARVQVRDASGAAGGFTWRFTVGDDQPEGTPATKP
jgi:hypothetical protein